MLEIREVIRAQAPRSAKEFWGHWGREKRPVVLTNGLAESAAISRWTLDYLREAAGDTEIVFNSTNQLYSDMLGGGHVVGKKISFGTFLNALEEAANDSLYRLLGPEEASLERLEARNKALCGANEYGFPLYLPLSPLRKMAALQDDVVFPGFFMHEQEGFKALWVGSSMGSLHYDTVNGLLGQVRGTKIVTMFSPADARRLYLQGMLHVLPNHSFVGFYHSTESVLADKYPKALSPTRYRCSMEPGDTLFIPNGWFHSISASPDSVSLTFWNKIGRADWLLNPLNRRILMGLYLKKILRKPAPRH